MTCHHSLRSVSINSQSDLAIKLIAAVPTNSPNRDGDVFRARLLIASYCILKTYHHGWTILTHLKGVPTLAWVLLLLLTSVLVFIFALRLEPSDIQCVRHSFSWSLSTQLNTTMKHSTTLISLQRLHILVSSRRKKLRTRGMRYSQVRTSDSSMVLMVC